MARGEVATADLGARVSAPQIAQWHRQQVVAVVALQQGAARVSTTAEMLYAATARLTRSRGWAKGVVRLRASLPAVQLVRRTCSRVGWLRFSTTWTDPAAPAY